MASINLYLKHKNFDTNLLYELLWQKSLLGKSDLVTLTRTAFYLIGTWFRTWDCQEHKHLVRYPTLQITARKFNDKDCLVNEEFASKTNWRGFGKSGKDPKFCSFCFCFCGNLHVLVQFSSKILLWSLFLSQVRPRFQSKQ